MDVAKFAKTRTPAARILFFNDAVRRVGGLDRNESATKRGAEEEDEDDKDDDADDDRDDDEEKEDEDEDEDRQVDDEDEGEEAEEAGAVVGGGG